MSNRDLATERNLILEACKAAGFDGTDLADLALDRAGLNPIRDLETRDFGRDAVEEASDGENYGTWAIKQLALFPESEERAEAMYEIALMMEGFATAYLRAQRFRALMRHIRNDVRTAAAA